MEQSIYIIKKNYSDWELCPQTIMWSDDLAFAEKFVKEKKEEYAILEKIEDQISNKRNELRTEIMKKFIFEKQIDIPKWPAGLADLSITSEMRDERNSIKKQNEEIGKRNADKWRQIDEELVSNLVHLVPNEYRTHFDDDLFFKDGDLDSNQPYSIQEIKEKLQ